MEGATLMRTVVTGGAGFIGSTLVDRLVTDGHEVVILDDLSNGRVENLAEGSRAEQVEHIKADITGPDLAAAIAVADRFMHLLRTQNPTC